MNAARLMRMASDSIVAVAWQGRRPGRDHGELAEQRAALVMAVRFAPGFGVGMQLNVAGGDDKAAVGDLAFAEKIAARPQRQMFRAERQKAQMLGAKP